MAGRGENRGSDRVPWGSWCRHRGGVEVPLGGGDLGVVHPAGPFPLPIACWRARTSPGWADSGSSGGPLWSRPSVCG